MHIVYFGTYDLNKPRNRLIINALRERGHTVTETHKDVWGRVADKSEIGTLQLLLVALRWIFAYPSLIWRYCRAPRHDAVMIGYLGHLDVLVVWPFAKCRRVRICWDAYLSIYDTMVRDRRILDPANLLARIIFLWEGIACRAADSVILDTRAHAEMFAQLYKLDRRKMGVVPLGVELVHFPRQPAKTAGKRLRVLLYGQFSPLHGVSTVIAAACRAPDIDWVLIGTGQETARISSELKNASPISLEWQSGIAYEKLIDQIAAADVCLGIFGGSEKAASVIPNKVLQILAAGRPLVTRAGPGIAEIVDVETPGIRLVPPQDSEALLSAVRELGGSGEVPPASIIHRFDIRAIGDAADLILLRAARTRSGLP
jgi:glycosyltransferase involved in cell wall biosynthesis